MDFKEIFKQINKGSLSGAYLYFGEEEYIKEEALAQTIDSHVNPSLKDFNYVSLEGEHLSLEDIINSCETLPLMDDKRLVVIRDLPIINGKSDKLIDEVSFINYLKRITDTTLLILYNRGKLDKRKRIYKEINKSGKAFEFLPLNSRDLHIWINQQLRKQGKKISYEAIESLLDKTGNSLDLISKEIEKLLSYLGKHEYIDKDIVDSVITNTLEQSIFQLVDAIGSKKTEDALLILNNLLVYGNQAPQAILSMIARQFRLILSCKYYYNKNYTYNMIADNLKQRVFVIKKCINQGHNFSIDELGKGLEYCLEIDYDIKNGRIEEELGLELIIIKMSQI